MLGGGVSTILYWSLLSYLFRLDAMQTMICIVTIWVVGFVAGVCAVGAILATFASVLG
jgi:predicted CDP-diglyceride synthetase/phosphatidate cytidylyltransferase